MPQITIRMAELNIGVECLCEETLGFLSDYAVPCAAPDFSVAVNKADIKDEEERCKLQYAREGLPYPNLTPALLERTAVYRKIAKELPRFGAFVFHGSAVAVKEKAVVFTAPSGTGKTTHTRLWLKNVPESFVVNGDKPILRLVGGRVFICGTPWMGKENLGKNAVVPLAGICVLTRGSKNTIEPVPFLKVMPLLIGQTYRPPEQEAMNLTLKYLETVAEKTPLYLLTCNTEDEAAAVSYNAMMK